MRLMIPCCAALLTLAACDGATPGADGPLRLGIVSGNNQVATAGAQQLGQPVVGKLVRTPGGIAFNLVTPAYAQGTVVNGSPVAGAVVCAVEVSDAALKAFTPCTNTEADGTATFFFSPGTKAGEARSEIRGTVEGQPAVFDTVVASVQPGPAVTGILLNRCSGFSVVRRDTLDVSGGAALEDRYRNPIAWRFAPFGPSSIYSVTADSQAIVAAPGASGIDSVRVMAGETHVRTSYVYVRHPQANGSTVLVYNWPADRQCGDIALPPP